VTNTGHGWLNPRRPSARLGWPTFSVYDWIEAEVDSPVLTAPFPETSQCLAGRSAMMSLKGSTQMPGLTKTAMALPPAMPSMRSSR